MNEGAATLGVWLPLAMCQLVRAVRQIGGCDERMSDVLRGFMLPRLAAAMENEERELEERGTVEAFEALGEVFKKKVITDG